MRLTDEQIRQKAEAYLQNRSKATAAIEDLLIDHLTNFAKSLFKETEEETFDRLCNDTSNEDKSGLEMSILYHKERTRIENE